MSKMRKRKNMVAFVLAVVLAASLFGNVTAFADDGEIAVSGTCGDNLYWILYDDGQLFVCGTGDMEDTETGNGSSAEWLYEYGEASYITGTSLVVDGGNKIQEYKGPAEFYY